MKILRVVSLLFAIAALMLVSLAQAQSPADSGSSSAAPSANSTRLTYTRPTQKIKLHNYFFDTVGPYPIIGAALAAGINQADNTPPEWRQGAEAYGKRFGSNFGIAAISTTTRYALAEALGEDTLYYRCECKGVFPRLGHAMISTFTARRGDDGHRVFSIPALVSPYVGTTAAVYAWYPGRYDVKDAFRMGNYSLLGYAGANVALEFLFGGPHSLLNRLHLKHGDATQAPASRP
jgi:hypothetical protein